jgi:GT2 family glycosyltransferase
MNSPNLSIIIISYNTQKLTADCIKSIISSKPKLKYEIIVVDNASTDESVEAIKELFQKSQFAGHYSLITNSHNRGFAVANNQGIKSAKAEHILLLNSDTKVLKDSLDKLYEFAYYTSDCAAVVPKLLNPDKSVQPSVFRSQTIPRAIKQYWLNQKSILDKYAPKTTKPTKIEVAAMAAFLITPRALRRVGMLNPSYFMYYEDFDYCRRIKKYGLSLYYLPDAQVVHYHGASGKKLADNDNQWRRLIPSSKIYHGILKHYIYNFILWSGQKIHKH